MQVNRGDVWWVDFDPSRGGEIQKVRPAVVISNNIANQFLNRIVVVPITSKTDKLYPGEAMITLNGERRKAMADQIMTASKERLKNKLGVISASDLNAIVQAILGHLGIE